MKTFEYKNFTIETDEFKSIIVEYISKFRQYISKEQYSFLLKKWKNELSTIKGIYFLDFNKFEDFMNWKVSILNLFNLLLLNYLILLLHIFYYHLS